MRAGINANSVTRVSGSSAPERAVAARPGDPAGPARACGAALAPAGPAAALTGGPRYPLDLPDPAHRPDRARPPDRRAPLLRPDPAHRRTTLTRRTGRARGTGLAPLTLRARRAGLTRRTGRALQASGPAGSREARARRRPGPAPAPGRRRGGRRPRRAGPAGAARGVGRLRRRRAVRRPAEGLPAVPLPFGDSVGAAVSGAGSVMVLLDRAVLRVLSVQDQYHECRQQSRHQQRSEAAQAAGEQGDHPGRVPGIRPPMSRRSGVSQGPPEGYCPACRFSGCTARTNRSIPARCSPPCQQAEAAGFDAAMWSDHFSPWSARQGHSGVRVVLAGRGAAGDALPFGVVNAPGPALPPGDHRAGDRHARRDVPGPVLGRAGHRRGQQRAHHRRRLAAQGGAQRPAARVRRRHPGAAARRGGQPRRAGHASTAPGCGRGRPSRRR